ncbi:hypothetical protein T09_13853 [Trichinella sp. T9]|nr:hypothetical protein T09_13853 [Trichinella sp. T9]
MRSLISPFISKLAMFKRNLGGREFYQFPSVAALRENGEVHDDDIQIYCDHLDMLQKDMQERFQDILKMKILNWVIDLFSNKKKPTVNRQRGDLRLFLTNIEPNVDRLVALHQPHPSH